MNALYIPMAIMLATLTTPKLTHAVTFNDDGYEDCIINKIGSAMTIYGARAIKEACKRKHPQEFDFDAIAKNKNVVTWGQVCRNKEFVKINEKQKEEGRKLYFEEIIKPNVHQDFINEAARAFTSHANKAC